MFTFRLAVAVIPLALLAQQEQAAVPPSPPEVNQAQTAENEPPVKSYAVETGTRVPLSLINSVSTKQAAEGDRVYLESVFPILVDGKVVIPPGSYVAGTVTSVKRPGRVKGRGEIYIRFDSLTLPNGVTRDFRGRIGSLDGLATEKLDREEGKVSSDGNKGGDARTIGEAAAAGTSIGAIAGSVGGRTGMGVGIGAAAGAAAGLIGVLASRGPDAVLAKGTTLEMVLDRRLSFSEDELEGAPPSRRSRTTTAPAPRTPEHRPVPSPGRGVPISRIP
jgi:type IV secretion system protein VirB10